MQKAGSHGHENGGRTVAILLSDAEIMSRFFAKKRPLGWQRTAAVFTLSHYARYCAAKDRLSDQREIKAALFQFDPCVSRIFIKHEKASAIPA